MKLFNILIFLSFSTFLMGQEADNDILKKIIELDNQVAADIAKDIYHRHEIVLNSNEKNWGGVEGYVERINCYFEIKDDGEVRLVKIIATLQQGLESAYHNFLFNEKEEIIMTYTDFIRGEESIGQQGAYFGDKNIAAIAINDKIFVGDELTDDMVATARKAYLKARKYKQMFITLLSVQLSGN